MTQTSKEYAVALFSLAKEENAESAYMEALKNVRAVFDENPAYMDLLLSPNVPKNERLDALKQAFASRVPEKVLSFLLLLCSHNRLSLLPSCIDTFAAFFEQAQNKCEATVISAVELTEEEKKALEKKLEKMTGQDVLPRFTVDPAVLGGLLIEMDGRVLDGTLKTRLHNVKEVMNK